jgi:hypothetical protein
MIVQFASSASIWSTVVGCPHIFERPPQSSLGPSFRPNDPHESGVDKALVELKATGQMTAAAKGTLGRETAEKVEQVEELNARSRKYNLPSASAP